MLSMTATKSFTVDTNILIYSIDRSDPAKQHVADRILRSLFLQRALLPLQALNEFYRATTRKRLLTPAEASAFVRDTLMFVVPISSIQDDLLQAMSLHKSGEYQFFDSLLIATSARAGCSTLFSEDLHDGRPYGSLTVRNPFKLSATELDALLA